MKRFLFFAAVAAVAVLSSGGRAQAGFLSSVYTSGVDNTLFDESREAFVDLDANGRMSVGDVLVGFVRIGNVDPSAGDPPNHIYAIFSQQISFAGVIIDPDTLLPVPTIFFAPTGSVAAAPGLTLASITGAATNPNGIVAVYDSFTAFTDFTLTSPGDTTGNGAPVNIFDYFKAIIGSAGSTLELVAGIAPGITDDYFQANPTIPLGFRLTLPGGPPNGTGSLTTINTSQTVANFHAGMTVLQNFDPLVTYSESVVSTNGGLHQLVISSGTASGENGAVNNLQWDNVNHGASASNNTAENASYVNTGGFTDKANFIVHPDVVPEPATIVLFSGGFLALGIGRLVRRRRSPVAP